MQNIHACVNDERVLRQAAGPMTCHHSSCSSVLCHMTQPIFVWSIHAGIIDELLSLSQQLSSKKNQVTYL
jgi:hypothetical protein